MKNVFGTRNNILWSLIMVVSAAAVLHASAAGSSVYGIFTRDLTLGSKGDDVTALQQILFDKHYLRSAPTGYFGAMTKAALAGLQKDSGIAPATGYFGTKTRAMVISLVPSSDPSSTSATPAMQTPSNTQPALKVTLSAENPVAGALISNGANASARVPVLGIDLAAGTESDVTISELRFRKVGFVSDNAISGAYIIEDGQVMGVYSSLVRGVIDFAGLNIAVPAGKTETLWLAVDAAPGLNPGNKISFVLSSASDIGATNASGTALAADGGFPLTGNDFTITSVSNPPLASLTVSPLAIGTDIAVPFMDDIAGAWNFTVTNSRVLLKGLNIFESGGSYDGQNLRLFVNGHQVGAPVASPDANDYFYFDLRDQPGVLNSGPNTVQIYADLPGSAGDSFQMQILNPYDIYAVDSQYNVPIAGQADPGTAVNIEAAVLTVQRAH